MLKKTGRLSAFVLCATLIFPVTAPQAVSTRPPLGLQIYCLQNPGDCRSAPATSAPFSDNLLHVLGEVNTTVNRAIRPTGERRGDEWKVGTGSGDCEDYVMTKRAYLLKKGLPQGALLVAYTRTRSGEGHAVLIVRTTEGDLVLDNLNSQVRSLRSSGYVIERVSTNGLLHWTAYR